MKPPSYNHNIVYRGCTFHVQTEDLASPCSAIVTHIFSAGAIVHTLRKPYAAADAELGLQAHTAVMQRQHQDAMRSLLHGAHDTALKALGIALGEGG